MVKAEDLWHGEDEAEGKEKAVDEDTRVKELTAAMQVAQWQALSLPVIANLK